MKKKTDDNVSRESPRTGFCIDLLLLRDISFGVPAAILNAPGCRMKKFQGVRLKQQWLIPSSGIF